MIVAYTALHYGSCYLSYAIRSVIDAVDKYVILYSVDGSHGVKSTMPLPQSESRERLENIAYRASQGKLEWVDGEWSYEGQQRDTIYTLYSNAEVILVLDYDEIWSTGLAEQSIAKAKTLPHKYFRLPMIHYWRSFHRAVMHDPAWPVRLIRPRLEGDNALAIKPELVINHLGYAIPSWLLDYKMAIHGHRGQWRQDINWRQERWEANAQQDCHPVGSEHWNPEPIAPYVYMPGWMSEHPYANQDIIESELIGERV